MQSILKGHDPAYIHETDIKSSDDDYSKGIEKEAVASARLQDLHDRKEARYRAERSVDKWEDEDVVATMKPSCKSAPCKRKAPAASQAIPLADKTLPSPSNDSDNESAGRNSCSAHGGRMSKATIKAFQQFGQEV